MSSNSPVSYAIVSAVLAVLLLPAASVKVEALTEIEDVPDVLAVGVKVAEYKSTEPVKSDSVPFETVMSSNIKFVAGSDNVNVIVEVSPALSVPLPERAIKTVGAVVSMVKSAASSEV